MKNQLEIHHVSVSGGDATVIAVYDKSKITEDEETNKEPVKLILVDAGNSESDMHLIKRFLIKKYGTGEIDITILSHAHKDHIGGMGTGTMVFQKLIHGKYIKQPVFKAKSSVQITKYDDSTCILDLGNDIKMYCICANGLPMFKGFRIGDIMDEENEKSKEVIIQLDRRKIKDDNDLSMAWILNFGEFNYYTSGDLSGSDFCGYNNIEGDLLKLFQSKKFPFYQKPMHVMKANHHGSKFSSYGKSKVNPAGDFESPFLKTLNPETIVIPCNNRHLLPDKEYLGRVYKNCSDAEVYLVNEFQRSTGSVAYKKLALKTEWEQQIKNLDKRKINITIGKQERELECYSNYKTDDIQLVQKEEFGGEDDLPLPHLPVVSILKKDINAKYNNDKKLYEVRLSKVPFVFTPGKGGGIKMNRMPKKINVNFILYDVPTKNQYYNSTFLDPTYFGHMLEYLEISRDNIPLIVDAFRTGANEEMNQVLPEVYDLNAILEFAEMFTKIFSRIKNYQIVPLFNYSEKKLVEQSFNELMSIFSDYLEKERLALRKLENLEKKKEDLKRKSRELTFEDILNSEEQDPKKDKKK